MSFRRERWLKLSDANTVKVVIIAVEDDRVLVNQSALDILVTETPGHLDTEEESWLINYEIMAALLGGQGFRKWESDDEE